MYFEGAAKQETDTEDKEAKSQSFEKQANLLVSDAIGNYKTVASFGNDQIILKEFETLSVAKTN